ncbi:MAG: YfiR family protein [Azoarcus sp.]|jgi:hypothetical protein|nr:YfiR family protein [Azoarcus sp.]
MKKSFFSLFAPACVLVLFASLMFSADAQQGATDASEAPASRLITIFWGIVGYTQWPDAKESFRICLSGDNRHLAMIRQSAIKLGHGVATLSLLENAATSCDIVYVSGTGDDEAGKLPRLLDGAPVLSIGEGEDFCSMGGMFCLLSSDKEDGAIDEFAVNLDAISRSTLRINPQVLRLSKNRREH